jgi:hypothetical protein
MYNHLCITKNFGNIPALGVIQVETLTAVK